MSAPVRVLIVDDSAYVRMALSRMLGSAPDIEVVGQAGDGQQALMLAAQLKPDVITLDVEMPKLTGLQVLQRLLPVHPLPVVMLSSLTQRGAEVTLEALRLGAVDFVGKPGSAGVPDLEAVRRQLLLKIQAAAQAKVHLPAAAPPKLQVRSLSAQFRQHPTVLIASSTGGPGTLDALLSALPPSVPAAFAITQHMPPHFTRALAQRLDDNSPLAIREAEEGDLLRPGGGLVAPGDYHMIIGPQGIVHLSKAPPVYGVRPAADPMMSSAADNLRVPLLGVVLTGMGTDGAEGVTRIKRAGGVVVAQDEQSCVIYGMPKAAAATGACDHIVSLADMPQLLTDEIHRLATAYSPGMAAASER